MLDQDPVTKIATSVAFVGRDPRGHDVVVISKSSGQNALRANAAYDMSSGICVGLAMVDPVLHTDTELSLVQKE